MTCKLKRKRLVQLGLVGAAAAVLVGPGLLPVNVILGFSTSPIVWPPPVWP